jgi:GNAT superfamily N-acetyltransferase
MPKRKKFDWSVREMRATDLVALMQIKNDENWNQTEDDWLFLIKSNPKYCLVAVSENRVIGTVTAINYHQKLAWIGMMLVSKKYRGLGVSKVLMNTIIKKLDKCHSVKLDATPAGVPVYEKLNFSGEYKIDRMVCSRLPVQIIDQENTGTFEISDIIPDDISSIGTLDKLIFGVERSELFHYLLDNKKEIAFQIKQGDQLIGFVFGRKGSNHLQIGPLLADSLQVAKWLLISVFKKVSGKSLLVDVLTDQQELQEWLRNYDFKQKRSFTRMYLKTNNYCKKKEKQFLISGPELG